MFLPKWYLYKQRNADIEQLYLVIFSEREIKFTIFSIITMGCTPAKHSQSGEFTTFKPKTHQVTREPSVTGTLYKEPSITGTPYKEPSITSDDELNKGSDFEEFIIPFESDSDEIQIPPTEDEYPAPMAHNKLMNPPDCIKWFEMSQLSTGSDENKGDTNNQVYNRTKIEEHAKSAPRSLLESFKTLVTYLQEPFKSLPNKDEIMVRAILVWLSNQEVDRFKSEKGTKDTPLGFLSLLGQRRSTYSTFFTLLCRESGVKCAQIHGVCKAGNYQPGDRNVDDLTCLWNAVYVMDTWQIIHPYWVCISVFGKRSGGWIKLEESGKAVRKRQKASEGIVKNAFKEYYIMPDPQQFIYRCHPDDDKWQLLHNPISRDKFLDLPNIFIPFWGLGLTLVSEHNCVLNAENGMITITIHTPKSSANELNLDYELLFREGTSANDIENDMLKQDNIPRLVAKIRNATEWNFDIQCPVDGTYKIVIYGSPDGQPLLRLCQFRIECKKGKIDCKLMPFDSGLLGFGPGPSSEKAGLLLPSHRNGLVLIDRDKPTTLSFLLDSDVAKSILVKALLIDSNSNDCSSLVESKVAAKELKITTRIKKEGDYGLRILTGDRMDPYVEVVCNYLISTSNKFVKERANQRLARRNLLASIENGGMDEIQKSIDRCVKEKIPESDSDIENAQRKLDVLKFRNEVHQAYLRRHLEITERTIHHLEQSAYKRIFLDSIRHLERQIEELRSLKGFTQELPNILSALTELNHTHAKNDIVVNSLMALLLLFGDTLTEIETIDDIQVISRDLAHKLRVNTDHSFKKTDAVNARKCISKFTYDQTRTVSMAAASVYKWVDDVISTLISKENEGE